MALINIRNLVKEYGGSRVVSIPELSFEQDRIYCIYGTNGSGKTTLFEMLVLVSRPSGGRIVYDGSEVFPAGTGIRQLRAEMTLVHQNPLMFDMSVAKNVDYGLRIRAVPERERSERVRECLGFVGLDGFQSRSARSLSGGEVQRVAIARALAIRPRVLLLDEFSANVDADNRSILEKIIRKINDRFQTTVIFTTHYLDQAYRLAETVVHLYKGRVVPDHPRNLFRGILCREQGATVFKRGGLNLYVAAPGEGEAAVTVPVNAITVSKEPLASSMRNCLKGPVRHIIDEGRSVIIRVAAGEIFEAQLSRESFHEMQLGPGTEVYLSFKATAVRVL